MKTLDEYQQEVLRTTGRTLDAYPWSVQEAHAALLDRNMVNTAAELLKLFDQLVWCLGLAGEVGETLDLLKKSWGHGHPLDLEKLKKEFGDVRWYGAALENSFGFKSSEVAQANADKLRARYPSGFTVEASKAKADEKPTARVTHADGCVGYCKHRSEVFTIQGIQPPAPSQPWAQCASKLADYSVAPSDVTRWADDEVAYKRVFGVERVTYDQPDEPHCRGCKTLRTAADRWLYACKPCFDNASPEQRRTWAGMP